MSRCGQGRVGGRGRGQSVGGARGGVLRGRWQRSRGPPWAVRDRCELQGRPGYPPLNVPRKDTSGAYRRLLPAPSPSPGENQFPFERRGRRQATLRASAFRRPGLAPPRRRVHLRPPARLAPGCEAPPGPGTGRRPEGAACSARSPGTRWLWLLWTAGGTASFLPGSPFSSPFGRQRGGWRSLGVSLGISVGLWQETSAFGFLVLCFPVATR